MKKLSLFLAVTLFFVSASAQALSKKEYIFRQPNNPANYVKLDKIKKKEAEKMALNHPYKFTEEQMANILRSLVYARQALFGDKITTRQVFEEEYVEKYTPLLVEAFERATPYDRVIMSVAQQRPLVIIRNDRLTQVAMWVAQDGLHMDFIKTEAKLAGDYQANTQAGQKMIQDAKGLRISLDPQPGQKLSFNSARELILDPNADWAAVVAKIEAEEEKEKLAKERNKGRKTYSASDMPATQPAVSPKDQKTAMQRLEELKKLKDKGLISEEDYDKKKEEILKDM